MSDGPTISKRAAEALALARARDLPNARTGMDLDALRRSFIDHLQYSQGKDEHSATDHDRYVAIARAVRDRMINRWILTQQSYYAKDVKRVYYLSLEFLMGRALGNNLLNLGLYDPMRQAISELGLELTDLLEQEPDAGLGNGGLGRLAACFLDSMATLSLPAYGYGIRYEFGIFDQEIRNGYQIERPEEWLRYGNPWEIARPEYGVPVHLYGRTERHVGPDGKVRTEWVDTRRVLGMPYDTPIVGYRNNIVNTLRLWRARAWQELDLEDFNKGDYFAAVAEKNLSEEISKVLYPNDVTVMGKELRLRQQYFFVACSIADIVHRYKKTHTSFANFPSKVAIQLNDTHPAIAIAELMRVFVDIEGLEWSEAWELCRQTFGYTNHTLLPEALERWTVELFGRVLPRHLEIVYEINERFLEQVRAASPGDGGKLWRMSLIEEGPVRYVRMANLAVVGSHSVNGVAALHTELLKKDLFGDFNALWPERFNSKTNGVTPRRWLALANPRLAATLTECIGEEWTRDLGELKRLEPLADDERFRARFREVKQENKLLLAELIREEHGFDVGLESIFDVQVKRLHEYKRQLLAALYVISLYRRLKADPKAPFVPRTFIFAGKAAPGYHAAKLIIKLLNNLGETLRRDPDMRGKLDVVFLRNYRVSLAERIFPAADLSEQISTAGKEASGTGNMKFALNGALTIGTLDGANVEIREEVGAENFFLFGATVDELKALRAKGYHPWDWYRADPELKAVLDTLAGNTFCPDEPGLFRPLVDSLLDGGDPYFLLADFASYVACQAEVSRCFLDQEKWTKMAILNVARMAKFSSDRTIQQYADEIWGVKPVKVR